MQVRNFCWSTHVKTANGLMGIFPAPFTWVGELLSGTLRRAYRTPVPNSSCIAAVDFVPRPWVRICRRWATTMLNPWTADGRVGWKRVCRRQKASCACVAGSLRNVNCRGQWRDILVQAEEIPWIVNSFDGSEALPAFPIGFRNAVPFIATHKIDVNSWNHRRAQSSKQVANPRNIYSIIGRV